jgi:hypothetical protein
LQYQQGWQDLRQQPVVEPGLVPEPEQQVLLVCNPLMKMQSSKPKQY